MADRVESTPGTGAGSDYLADGSSRPARPAGCCWPVSASLRHLRRLLGLELRARRGRLRRPAIAAVVIAAMYLHGARPGRDVLGAADGRRRLHLRPRALGPWGGFATGTAILIEYAIAPAAIATFIGAYVESLGLFGITDGWWVYLVAYALFVGIHLTGVGEALKVMFVVTAVALVGLVVFVIGAIALLRPGQPRRHPGRRRGRRVGVPAVRRARHLVGVPVRDLVLPRRRGRAAGRRGGARPGARRAARDRRRHARAARHGGRRARPRPRRAAARAPSRTSDNPLVEALGPPTGRPGRRRVNYIGLAGWSPASSRSSTPTRGRRSRSRAPATCRGCCR